MQTDPERLDWNTPGRQQAHKLAPPGVTGGSVVPLRNAGPSYGNRTSSWFTYGHSTRCFQSSRVPCFAWIGTKVPIGTARSPCPQIRCQTHGLQAQKIGVPMPLLRGGERTLAAACMNSGFRSWMISTTTSASAIKCIGFGFQRWMLTRWQSAANDPLECGGAATGLLTYRGGPIAH